MFSHATWEFESARFPQHTASCPHASAGPPLPLQPSASAVMPTLGASARLKECLAREERHHHKTLAEPCIAYRNRA